MVVPPFESEEVAHKVAAELGAKKVESDEDRSVISIGPTVLSDRALWQRGAEAIRYAGHAVDPMISTTEYVSSEMLALWLHQAAQMRDR
ncbi:MAG: hypothetical protein JWO35_604 [Candidatus Saccharibacteria bacterium]|nr:hypothetical protein [Candidatus Saccharibacteria bacterium]